MPLHSLMLKTYALSLRSKATMLWIYYKTIIQDLTCLPHYAGKSCASLHDVFV
jgi:hypothetical protein